MFVTILTFFRERKRKIPINNGFKLLGYLKIPQFPYPIAEVRLEVNITLLGGISKRQRWQIGSACYIFQTRVGQFCFIMVSLFL